MIKEFFYTILYQPLFNLLFFLYQNFSFSDFGIAIVLMTIVIRLILYPLFSKSARDQVIMQKIAPKLQEIQNKHKEDKQKQVEEMMKIYKDHNVNPFSSFVFLLFIQLPILITLFQIFSSSIKEVPAGILYSFVKFSGTLNTEFLGKIDLTQASVLLVILSAIFQYYQGTLTSPKSDRAFKNLSAQERMARQMVYIGPILTLVILWKLPAAIALYWLTTTIFSVIQQLIINKQIKIVKDHGTIAVRGDN